MSTHPAPAARFDDITTYLSWDHDRLDGILIEVSRLADAGRPAEARETYRAFDAGLLRHIRLEEELLFPLFEARSGITGGPTEVMREEHREILRAIELMREGLAREDLDRFHEGLRFLRTIMPDHNAKEEHVLYPTTDRLLTDPERAAFTARLQRE